MSSAPGLADYKLQILKVIPDSRRYWLFFDAAYIQTLDESV
jgi:hypothetical protein